MTATATQLPVGTRVRITGFGARYEGMTGVVTGHGTSSAFKGWAWVTMDRAATAREADLGFPADRLVALPEPTVSLVKAPPAPAGFVGGGVPLDMDPVSGERWDDGLEAEAPSAAERIAHLEWLLDRASGNLADQAQLIQDQKADRDQLRDQLQERDAWIVKLETTLADTRQQTREQATRAGRLDEQLGQAQARIAELETALATTWTEVQADRKRQADRIAVLEDRLARVAVYAARLENLDRAGTERVNSFQAAETLKAILAS